MPVHTRWLGALPLLMAVGACEKADLLATHISQAGMGGVAASVGQGGALSDGGSGGNGAADAGGSSDGSGAPSGGFAGGGTEAGSSNSGGSGTGGRANAGGAAGVGGGSGASGSAGSAESAGSTSGGGASGSPNGGTAGVGGVVVAPTGLGKAVCTAPIGGANATVYVRSVAADSLGNLFVTGGFQGTANFGGKSLKSQGNSGLDLFIAKYTSKCVLVWAQSYSSNASGGPNSVDQGQSVAIAANGDVLVSGGTAAAIDLGGGIIAKNGGAFYARYTTDGVHVWSHLTSLAVSLWSKGIAVAPNGNVALVTDVGTSGSNPPNVSEYTSQGNPIWSTPIDVGPANFQDTMAEGVAVNPNGNVFVAGEACPKAGCGVCPLGKSCFSGARNMYLAAYTPGGAPSWANVVTPDSSTLAATSAYNQGLSVAADATSVVAGGLASPPLNFGSGLLPGFGNWDAFVARYTTGSGALVKAFLDGDTGADFISGVALDASSNVAFAGQSGTLHVVGVYSPTGTLYWINPLSVWSMDGVALAPNNIVAAVGEFDTAVNFGSGSVSPAGTLDGFLTTYEE